MLKKLRYGIVLLAAGVLLVGTVLVTGMIGKKGGLIPENSTENGIGSTEVPYSENETEEGSGEDSSEPSSSWETESEPATESEVETTEWAEVRDDTDKELVYNPADEENPYTGLRGYFFRKLKIDASKVSKYLNVRLTPSPEGRIRMVLHGDEIVPYIGMQGDWYLINVNGTYGYVHKNYVLTDYMAYLDMRDNIGFAAMVKTNMCYLFTDPTDNMTGVRTVGKSESFKVVGVTDIAYKVVGDFVNYPYLYMLKSNALLYYMFLEDGDDNGLENTDFEVLAKENVQENLERVYAIEAEIQEAAEIQESMRQSALESERQASVQASIERSKQAAASTTKSSGGGSSSTALTFLEQQYAYDAAHAQSRLDYYYTMMDEAKQYDVSQLQQITYTTTDGNGNTTTQELARVTYYCHCTQCCGVWGHDDVNYPANRYGVLLVENYSVAVDKNVIPIGTRMLAIMYGNDGKEQQRQIFLAQDTGVKGLSIDVYRKTHTYCHKAYDLAGPMPKGMYQAHYYVKLFILPN